MFCELKSFEGCSVRCHEEFAFLSHMVRSFPQMFFAPILASYMQVILLFVCQIPSNPFRRTQKAKFVTPEALGASWDYIKDELDPQV